MGKNNQARRKAKKKVRERRSKKLVVQSVRPCNGCTACCSVFGVAEIEKQPWAACEHKTGTGCSVYTTRPRMCKTFYCLWQNHLGSEEDRPDNIGVIFASTNGKTEFTGDTEIQAYEIWENAAQEAKPQRIMRRFASKGALVILHTYGGSAYRLMGPEKKVAQASEFLRKQ